MENVAPWKDKTGMLHIDGVLDMADYERMNTVLAQQKRDAELRSQGHHHPQ